MTGEIARPFSGKVCKNGLSRFFIDISSTCRFFHMKEDKASWVSFFLWLRSRGLDGVKLVLRRL